MTPDPVIHLVDDDAAVLHSLAFALTASGMAVRTHENGMAFLEAWPKLQPGCLVTDLRMPGIDGLELIARVRQLDPDFPIIMITGHGDVRLAVAAMKAGASDFIEKPFDHEVLQNAIVVMLKRAERAGDRVHDRQLIADLMHTLTAREREVLDGLMMGQPNKTIAYDLGISPRTVEVHRASVMTKMAAASLSQLIRKCLMARLPN